MFILFLLTIAYSRSEDLLLAQHTSRLSHDVRKTLRDYRLDLEWLLKGRVACARLRLTEVFTTLSEPCLAGGKRLEVCG